MFQKILFNAALKNVSKHKCATLLPVFPKVIGSPNFECQRRHLNLHEYQNFELLTKYGLATPKFGLARNKEEAKKVAVDFNMDNLVLKAQVLSGGRGKGTFKNGLKGGVQMVFSPEEAEEMAGKMLGQRLVTKQSGDDGKLCNMVMIIERKFPRREFYLALMMERTFGGPVIIASSQGGVNIEDVAKSNPDAIFYLPVDIRKGLNETHGKAVSKALGVEKMHSKAVYDTLQKMYKLFVENDCILIEINPFAEDSEGKFSCLDCKIKFDDNAKFRHKGLFAMEDSSQVDEKEVRANKYNLNYITLSGNIGCMVNGAGLAMATMDIISLYGGTAANFLDVGGGATKEAIYQAFKLIISDKNVRAILVNIFGGIIRCDLIAEGIILAAKELHLNIPIVCRLQGQNMDEAKLRIAQSGMKILPVDNLNEAARLSVKLAQIVALAKDAQLDVKFQLPI